MAATGIRSGDTPLRADLRTLVDSFLRMDTRWRMDWALTSNEGSAITALWHVGGLTMGEMARIVGLSTGGATALVDRLVRDGYVVRYEDPEDRRKQLVRLTDKGFATRSPMDAVLDRVEASVDHDAAREVVGAFISNLSDQTIVVNENLVHRAQRVES